MLSFFGYRLVKESELAQTESQLTSIQNSFSDSRFELGKTRLDRDRLESLAESLLDDIYEMYARTDMIAGYAHQIEHSSYEGHKAEGSDLGMDYDEWVETRAKLIMKLADECEDITGFKPLDPRAQETLLELFKRYPRGT